MSRYFTKTPVRAARPRAEDWDDSPLILNSICVSDHEAADTGLVDHRGDAIMRAPNPVGFGRDEEW
jgi:hypothetical protein